MMVPPATPARATSVRVGCLAALLAVTAAAAQDTTIKPDDGLFPLTSEQVGQLQEMLANLGYDPGPINGIVGPQTAKAASNLAGLLRREVVRRPSGDEVVLSCKIEEGAPGFKNTRIMVDETRGIVIYNYLDVIADFNPIHMAEGNYLDFSMNITINTDTIIQADDESSAILIGKLDGKFVHSFVTPISIDPGVVFGNTLWGTCAKDPFN